MEQPVDMSDFLADSAGHDDDYEEDDDGENDSSLARDEDVAIFDSTKGSCKDPADLMVHDPVWHGHVTIQNPDVPTEFWILTPAQAAILFGFDTTVDFDPAAPGHFIRPVFETLGPRKCPLLSLFEGEFLEFS